MGKLTGLVILSVCLAAASAAPGGQLVLDETAYWRVFYRMGLMRLSGAALKAEGETLLDKRTLQQLEKRTKVLRSKRGLDWTKTDWRDYACMFIDNGQGGGYEDGAVASMPQTRPPANWMAPEFDDQAWLRRNTFLPPRCVMKLLTAAQPDLSFQHIKGVCARTYFEVPDPGKSGDLTLRIAYRGGARVFLNGTELARRNLPPGELGAQVHADDYPKEAYLSDDGKALLADLKPEPPAPPARKTWQRVKKIRDRVLDRVAVPAQLLRKGRNVLAIEIVGSHYHPILLSPAVGPFQKQANVWIRNYYRAFAVTWDHAKLVKVELRSASPAVPAALPRPEETQVWAADMHTRVFSRDFKMRSEPAGTVRIVGARNGSFSAQVVVAAGKELTALQAKPSALKHETANAVIPVSAVEISYLHPNPITDLYLLGCARFGGDGGLIDFFASQYRTKNDKLFFFDHISAAPPERVAPKEAQPIWVRVQIPADTAPGLYKGSLAVAANGMDSVALPMQVEVIDWRIPGPLEFQTHVQSEQSPYGIAKHYKVPLWSDEHFRLMETSFRQLGRLGNDYVFIPVIHNTEFGNRRDSPLKWIRKKDGSLAFDYSIMDRYLELAVKHLGVPRVICFVIMQMGGGDNTPDPEVAILDEITGKEELVAVGTKQEATRKPLWTAFSQSLCAHLKVKGWYQSLYWGYKWDIAADRSLIALMAELTPDIYWAGGGHNANIDKYFRAVSRVYGTTVGEKSRKGWKDPFAGYNVKYGGGTSETTQQEFLSAEEKQRSEKIVSLLMPRCGGSVITVEGITWPFPYRVLADRAIYAGFGGIARMGADYYDRTWMSGCKNSGYYAVGRPCWMTLWPGKNGSESSVRNEAMLEGVQEAEARIFLEQTLERGVLSKEQAAEVQQLLDEHMLAAFYLSTGGNVPALMDYTGDWQARSRKLYTMGAKVARQVGIEAGRCVFNLALPAMGRQRFPLQLRNWTGSPRSWKAVSSVPWIVPAKSEGKTAGWETLSVDLDGRNLLEAGKKVTGTLTLTDLDGGLPCPIQFNVTVRKAVEFRGPAVMNFIEGEAAAVEWRLLNCTAGPQDWGLTSTIPGIIFKPDSGTIRSNETVVIETGFRPKEGTSGVQEGDITLIAAGGAIKETAKVKVFLIPPYQRPKALPSGKGSYLEENRNRIISHSQVKHWWLGGVGPAFGRHKQSGRTFPISICKKEYDHGMWVIPHHESVFKLADSGFTAFSAEVGIRDMNDVLSVSTYSMYRVSFELYVDGQLRAQSGIMKPGDTARLLVVDHLQGAKDLKLLTRLDTLGDTAVYNDRLFICHWADARFYGE